MSLGPRARILAGAALLSTCAGACSKEVTLHLFGETEDAGAPDDDAGLPPPPCQKLGAEVCNGGDDDCNGLIDEGCAYTVGWGPEIGSAILGHATGGVMFLEPCSPGAVLTGLRVGFGSWLNQVSAICRQMELHADATQSPVAFTVTLGPRHDTTLVPAASTDPKNQLQELLCPDGDVLTGVDGTTTTDEPRYIRAMRITCAPPVVVTSAAPGASPLLDADGAGQEMVGPFLCATCSASEPFNYSITIAPGHIATGLFGGDGLWIDRVGFGASVAIVSKK